MSGAATGSSQTTKLQDKKPSDEPPKDQQQSQSQAPALLEEDDEFEDFPVEGLSIPSTLQMRSAEISVTDWTVEEATAPGGNTHLWEESWDDDDQNEEFSKQLKYATLIRYTVDHC